MILKLHENASTSNINLSTYGLEYIKIELINKDK